MYIKGLEIEALSGTMILADTVQPYFDRTYKPYMLSAGCEIPAEVTDEVFIDH